MRLFDMGARGDGPATVHDRVWTAANGITFLRLLGLPLFVWLVAGAEAYGIALVTLVVVGATDWVDGYVARRFDQVTRLGRFLDPLIDRLLIATAGITFVVVGLAPWWLVGLVVLRDVLLMSMIAILFKGVPPTPVTRMGKFATACLLAGFPAFLVAAIDWSAAEAFTVFAYVFSIVGAVAYYVAGYQYGVAAATVLRARRGNARRVSG